MKIKERRIAAKEQLEHQLKAGTKPAKTHESKEWHKEHKDLFTKVNGKRHVKLTPTDIEKIKRQIYNLQEKLN